MAVSAATDDLPSLDKIDVRQLYRHLREDVLPKILEVEKKCDFLIKNHKLVDEYGKFLKVNTENSFYKPAKAVCEFYGYPLSNLDNVSFWADFPLRKQEHLDALSAYWSYKGFPFDTGSFTVSAMEKGPKNKSSL